jgi:hypothetical protein
MSEDEAYRFLFAMYYGRWKDHKLTIGHLRERMDGWPLVQCRKFVWWLISQQHIKQNQLGFLIVEYIAQCKQSKHKKNNLMRMPKAPPCCHLVSAFIPTESPAYPAITLWKYERDTGSAIDQRQNR